jgi:hypothetical protein
LRAAHDDEDDAIKYVCNREDDGRREKQTSTRREKHMAARRESHHHIEERERDTMKRMREKHRGRRE